MQSISQFLIIQGDTAALFPLFELYDYKCAMGQLCALQQHKLESQKLALSELVYLCHPALHHTMGSCQLGS